MKRQQARERGNVAKSQDLTAAVSLLAALLALRYFGPGMLEDMVGATRFFLSGATDLAPQTESATAITAEVAALAARIVLPFMVLMAVAGATANIVQVGFIFSPQAIAPKPSKLNPFTGFGRFFSARSFVELAKSVLKLILIGYVAYVTLANRWDQVLVTSFLTPAGIVVTLSDIVFLVWFRVVLVMIALGLLDYAFQRWQYERDLRMTAQEAREEMKQLEGDPRIKQRVRQIQRQMAMQRMMREVPAADVIITNPTTYAVALRYELDKMEAPVVTAKGARLLAQRIRDLGTEHRVPIVEKPELARALYRTVEVNRPVPESLYRAVAEVLRFVYEIDRRAEKMRERARFLAGLRPAAS